MKISIVLICCVIVLGSIAGCDSEDLVCACDPSGDISFSNVPDFEYFIITGSAAFVIDEEIDWLNLWVENWTKEEGGEKTAPPPIDFDTEMVIVLTWGTETGCDNISESIGFLLLEEDTLYVVSTGMDDLGFCDMVVFPIHMVKTRKRDVEVVFIGDLPALPHLP